MPIMCSFCLPCIALPFSLKLNTHTHTAASHVYVCVYVSEVSFGVWKRRGEGGRDSWLSVGYAGSRLHGSLAQMRKFTCSFLSTKQTPTHTHPYTLTYSSHTHTHICCYSVEYVQHLIKCKSSLGRAAPSADAVLAAAPSSFVKTLLRSFAFSAFLRHRNMPDWVCVKGREVHRGSSRGESVARGEVVAVALSVRGLHTRVTICGILIESCNWFAHE